MKFPEGGGIQFAKCFGLRIEPFAFPAQIWNGRPAKENAAPPVNLNGAA
jgi:hypothetical protein